jgi:hypothetical protein
MNTEIWRFQSACVSGTNLKTPFFIAESIAAADAGKHNSLFCTYFQDCWYSYQTTPEWSAIAIAAAKYPDELRRVVLAISVSGKVWELRPEDRSESLSSIPDQTGFTNLATIEDVIYGCGMGRVVMRRDSTGHWSDISAPKPDFNEGVIGFTALAGLSGSLLYAVGWRGEIWTYSVDGWTNEDAPTNANLNSLAIGSDGIVYAVGDGGAMLKGRRGHWEVVETETDFNLIDVCVHAGTVYVCTDFEVLRLGATGLQSEFREDDGDAPATCLKLVSDGANRLYSIGPYDVFLHEENSWRRLA